MLDCAIVNGEVFDGSGGPGRPLDIGIADGRIVLVSGRGELPDAAQQIDATGRIVTPGFVDPHTHMDAQLWWEPSGSPSVLHGVTSVVMSSCGFGVAPHAAGMDDYVLQSLESVEEIPFRSTRLALPMSWRSWGDFFQAVGELPLGVNVAAFVPHSALRVGVLGERGLAPDLEPAEIDQLVEALENALADGAVGISTSRGPNHTDATGGPVPSRFASDVELERLVAACSGRLWQINIQAKGTTDAVGRAAAFAELATYADWSERHDAVATWTPLVVAPGDDVAWRALLEFSKTRGERLLPQVAAQPISSTIGFDGPSFAGMIDGWAGAFAGFGSLDAAGRTDRVRSAAFRDALRSAPEDCSRITSPCYSRWHLVASPSAPDAVGLTLNELGDRAGTHPIDALVDLALADDLATVVGAPLSNLDDDAVRVLVTDPSTLIGLGDAGAHIKSITNYTYPTYVLGRLVRDRQWMSVGEAVRQLTAQPAEAVGIVDRGTIAEGAWADLCVIDLDRLEADPSRLVNDIPGDSARLHSGATGFTAVMVNGEVVVDHDQPTGRAAGRLLPVQSR